MTNRSFQPDADLSEPSGRPSARREGEMLAPVGYQTIKLSRGGHSGPENGACVMELASMLAGERFSDHPASVCPVIGSFLRGYNDRVDDDRRQNLYEYAALVVGSRAPAAVQRARADLLRAWALQRRKRHWARRLLPARWRAIGLDTHVPLYAAPDHAVRSVRRVSDETHATVLALIDEMLAIDSRPGIRLSSSFAPIAAGVHTVETDRCV